MACRESKQRGDKPRMNKKGRSRLIPTDLFDVIQSLMRRLVFQALKCGPMPKHMAFILDGNRRYGKKKGLKAGEAHQHGFYNVMNILRCCFEMGLHSVTLYAFSIDNFSRRPDEIRLLMSMILEKIEALVHDASIANKLGIRVEFLGKLELLDERMREAAERAMKATEKNNRLRVLVSIAYTSTEEIVHGVCVSCIDKQRKAVASERQHDKEEEEEDPNIDLVHLEKNMYFAGKLETDILVRTSGETRLSNFLLWQTCSSMLYAPRCLWPEFSFRHLVWAVLNFQKNYAYLDKIRKQTIIEV